jgi:hypothetical protein
MFQKIELRRTRDFSEKINATFEFIRQNIKPLAKSLIYISGPFILLQGFFNGFYQKQALGDGGLNALNALEMFNSSSDLIMWLGLTYIFILLGYISSIIVVYEFMRLYETKQNPETIDVPEVWEGVKENYLPMVGASIVVFFLIVFATLLLILPGIYVAIAFSLIAPIIIIEKKGLGEALGRCFKLITEKWWSTFGLIFVTSLISGVMALIFVIPQSVFSAILVLHGKDAVDQAPLWQQAGMVVSSMIYSFGANLLQSIVFVAIAFQFYNLIERKEAKGLMNKLESFGKPTEDTTSRNEETY